MKLESTISDRAGFLYIAPLFDGVLLLLAFFIFASNWVSKSGVEITLPASSSLVRDTRSTHVITIVEGNPTKLYFNDLRVDIPQLNEKLQSEKLASNQITILADQSSAYGSVMEVALLALQYNYEVAFGTKPRAE